MKKIILIVPLIAILSMLMLACNTASSVEISTVEYCFMEIDVTTNDPISSCGDLLGLSTGKKYLMMIDFSVTSRDDQDNNSMIKVVLDLGHVEVFRATLESSNTGDTDQFTYKNAEGEESASATASFTIPQGLDSTKDIKLQITIRPLKIAEDYIKMTFEPSDQVSLTGDSNGFTKLISLVPTKLETPILSFNASQLVIEWPHVNYATSYRIYVDNVYHSEIPVDPFHAVGDMISLPLPVSGNHVYKVQAFHHTTLFTPSNYSNQINAED